MKYKLLVFDWDGTLMDSQHEIITCFQQAAKEAALSIPLDDTVRNVIGLGMREAVEAVFNHNVGGNVGNSSDNSIGEKITDEEIQLFIEKYRTFYFSDDKPPSELYSGVFDMLKALEPNYFLSVATGKGRNGLNAALKRTSLDEVFHYSRCVDEAPSKPHPQMLQDSMDYLGVEAHKTLMIGDTEYDLEMAANAGVDSVGVYCGAHEAARLHKHNPQMCFHNTRELAGWLQNL